MGDARYHKPTLPIVTAWASLMALITVAMSGPGFCVAADVMLHACLFINGRNIHLLMKLIYL